MVQRTKTEVDSKYIPAFEDGDYVVLTKDCESYDSFPEFDNKFFNKGRLCLVIECGLSHFFVDKKFQPLEPLELVEDCQWCTVRALTDEEELGYPLSDEEYFVEGIVRARDLREGTESDII